MVRVQLKRYIFNAVIMHILNYSIIAEWSQNEPKAEKHAPLLSGSSEGKKPVHSNY